MRRADLDQWVKSNATFTFSRSGGPGGQNVNKVNTKVLATIPLDEDFTPFERQRITESLSTRINGAGELFVQSQRGRTQLENKKLAVTKLVALLSSALYIPTPRTATRPSRRTQERRLQYKRERSEKKRRRSWRRGSE